MKFKEFIQVPTSLKQKIELVIAEEDAYAADKLVELGNEILIQLAARGVAAYLQQEKQKEVFNDFLISLFLSDGHNYNAGVLYRWAANMLKDAEGEFVEILRPFFWQTKEGEEVLNEMIHHLASLRNAVMHGFFLLPPEHNREEAKKIEAILEQMNQANLFDKDFGDFHFLNSKGFSGQWKITGVNDWEKLSICYEFGALANRISHEYSDNFRLEEQAFASKNSIQLPECKIAVDKLLEKGKGAMVFWYPPGSVLGEQAYRTLIRTVVDKNFLPVYYSLHEKGATFTSPFLEREIGKSLYEHTQIKNTLIRPLWFLQNEEQNKSITKKPVIVLHDVHIALFNTEHLTGLFNKLYNAGIPILCTGWHYPYLKRFFNLEMNLGAGSSDVSDRMVTFSLLNYIRFKGPSREQNDEIQEYQKLKTIVDHLFILLKNREKVFARRFADQHNYPIEYVHEAFGILSPFYLTEKESFIEDQVDESMGFPKTVEESSLIFLTLGRRDLKLEYKHKVLIKR